MVLSAVCDLCGGNSGPNCFHSEFNLAKIEFRDNNFEHSIRVINKLISKGCVDKSVRAYKELAKLNLELDLFKFINQLQNLELNLLNSDVFSDYLNTLKNVVLPNNRIRWHYDSTFSYLEILHSVFSNQDENFKREIFRIVIDVFSWEQHQFGHDPFNEDGKHLVFGYRPQMVSEIDSLIKQFRKIGILGNYIEIISEVVENLYIQTVDAYKEKIIGYGREFIKLGDVFEKSQLDYNVSRYNSIKDAEPLLEILKINQIQFKDKNLRIDLFISDVNKINGEIQNILNEVDRKAKENDKRCFIVTATMGNSENFIVQEFRFFRDDKLLKSFIGRILVGLYYTLGPHCAFFIARSIMLRKIIYRFFVLPLYRLIKR